MQTKFSPNFQPTSAAASEAFSSEGFACPTCTTRRPISLARLLVRAVLPSLSPVNAAQSVGLLSDLKEGDVVTVTYAIVTALDGKPGHVASQLTLIKPKQSPYPHQSRLEIIAAARVCNRRSAPHSHRATHLPWPMVQQDKHLAPGLKLV